MGVESRPQGSQPGAGKSDLRQPLSLAKRGLDPEPEPTSVMGSDVEQSILPFYIKGTGLEICHGGRGGLPACGLTRLVGAGPPEGS